MMLKNFQPHGWFGPMALFKFLIFVLATWSILPSTVSRVIASSQCGNISSFRARQRMQRSACGYYFNFSCPETYCILNYNGRGGETAACLLDNYIDITVDGTNATVSVLYTTVAAWSPDEQAGIPPLTGESTRVDLAGGAQGSAQVTIFSSKNCALLVNEQECGCEMVYCPTDPSTARVQANCTDLGQGHLDACDDVHYGNPGDILRYLVLADSVCAQIGSSDNASPVEGAVPPESTGFIARSQTQCFWMLMMAGVLAFYLGF